jgi:hypothetical protein
MGVVIDRFILEIDSLRSTLPLAMRSITAAHAEAGGEFNRFLARYGKPVKGSNSIQIDTSQGSGFRKLLDNLNRASAASAIVPRSFLVALVSQYDSFLGQLIETLLLSKPEILNGADRALSFAELVGFDSIQAAREHVVEKEVESVLRESHSEQFGWMEKKFNLPLREGLKIWPCFIEITERRNLYVHTGGQVSEQYLGVCRNHQFDVSKTAKGDQLYVSPEYFLKAHAVIFEIGVKLANVLWRKLKPEERKAADQNLVLIGYNLVLEEQFELAKAILDFSTEVLKTHSSEDFRLRFVVNRAQAYKWSGDNARAMKILDNEDFSALSDGFRLAEAVLRENYKAAFGLVRAIGAHGDVSLEAYREWPLFREFRKQKELGPMILKIFKEPLNRIEVESKVPAGSGAAVLNLVASRKHDGGQGTDPVPSDSSAPK